MNKQTIAAVAMASALLSGCPDPKLPKKPPSVPEPKAGASALVQVSELHWSAHVAAGTNGIRRDRPPG